ncbi:MAG: dipeptide transporter ATP-binding protein DppD [Pseudomonadota bacterium]|jgi:oligopeptide/dipeptide ABC transporter ATP-binding protein
MTAATTAEPVPLLEVTDLRTHFHTEEGVLRAVDGISFQLGRGRTLALVGESGCGKSVTAQSVLRLIHPPGRIVSGSVRLHRGPGEPPLEVLEERESSRALLELRGGRAAFIFQEATASLSPVHTIGNQLLEAVRTHQKLSKKQATAAALEMLEKVGIEDPELCLRQYPHELSGGMRQRIAIAMALVSSPDLVIADEPTTALDVTIQAQVLALLKSLQRSLDLAILLITHDLGVVAQLADEVVVMYLGRVVESGPVRAILKKPRHPYTMGLLESLPSLTPIGKRLPSIRGSVPALSDIPSGCPFHPRCTYAVVGRCNVGAPPPLERFTAPGASSSSASSSPEERFVACWRTREVALERLMQRPAELTPSEPPPAVHEAEDQSERITQTAAPPAVGLIPGYGQGYDQAVEKLPESKTEAEWFDSSDLESDREGGSDGNEGKEPGS